MRSKFFRDAHELDSECGCCEPGKVCICLRIDGKAFETALARSQSLGVSSGEYVEELILREAEADLDNG